MTKDYFFHVNLYFAGFLPVLQESTLLARPGEAQRAVAEAKLYDARILPKKDLLTIVVSCSDPELAEPFNLTVSTPVSNTQKPDQPTGPSTISGRQPGQHRLPRVGHPPYRRTDQRRSGKSDQGKS